MIETTTTIFQNLEELQSYIDKNQIGFENEGSFTRSLKHLTQNFSDLDQEKLQAEIFVLDFIVEDGEAKPAFTAPGDNGLSFCYPAYEKFSEVTYNYINYRIRTTVNPLLKARYIQVLWNSPKKNRELAKEAIDIYLECLRSRNFDVNQEIQNELQMDVFKNGYSLALKLKYRADEYQEYADQLLFSSLVPDELKVEIIEFLLKQSKVKAQNLMHIEHIVREISDNYRNSNDSYYQKRNVNNVGLELAKRCGLNLKDWHRRIGEDIEEFGVNQIQDRAPWATMGFLQEAIVHYKNAGLSQKVKEVEEQYWKLKNSVELTNVPYSFELPEEFRQYFELKTEALLSSGADNLFAYLCHASELFPTKESLEKGDRKNHYLDVVTTYHLDININVSKQPEEGADLESDLLYQNYRNHLSILTLPLLKKVFFEGFKRNEITYEAWLKFILENSWFGQPLEIKDSAGTKTPLRWIALLAQPVHYYFQCLEVIIKDKRQVSFVMAIDSMTTKFEAALRDFARLSGISTSISGKGGTMREMYIEELFTEETIMKYFNEDDILFFKCVFVKNGLNLRNNIAHGFLRYQNYSIDHMHLLICAFLRLGKYYITPSTNSL